MEALIGQFVTAICQFFTSPFRNFTISLNIGLRLNTSPLFRPDRYGLFSIGL
jgi:hypothetical protein